MARGSRRTLGRMATDPAPTSLLYVIADQQWARLAAQDDAVLATMRARWQAVEDAATRALTEVTADIDAARLAGQDVSPAWLYRQARYRQMLATVAEQAALYGGYASQTTSALQAWAVGQAAADAQALGSQAAGVWAGDFLTPNPANLLATVGFLADGSPLADLFGEYGAEAVARVRDLMAQAITMGWGSAKTARMFRATLGMLATRAETVARTELHRAYRETSRRTYEANADVVVGWYWRAHIDPRTCPGCVAMDGTFHGVEDTLDGHPRCRCAMVPTTGQEAERNGLQWLRAQSPATQRAMLGPSKASALAAGEVDWGDLVTRTHDPRWGTMRREATLAEMRARAAARGTGKPRKAAPAPAAPPTAGPESAEAIRARTAQMRAEAERLRAQREALRTANLEAQARLQGIPVVRGPRG